MGTEFVVPRYTQRKTTQLGRTVTNKNTVVSIVTGSFYKIILKSGCLIASKKAVLFLLRIELLN